MLNAWDIVPGSWALILNGLVLYNFDQANPYLTVHITLIKVKFWVSSKEASVWTLDSGINGFNHSIF